MTPQGVPEPNAPIPQSSQQVLTNPRSPIEVDMSLTEIALLVISLATAAIAVSVVHLAIQGRTTSREAQELLNRLEPRMQQVITEATSTLQSLREVTERVQSVATNADHVLTETAAPLIEEVRRIRDAQRHVTALAKGARAAVLAFQRK